MSHKRILLASCTIAALALAGQAFAQAPAAAAAASSEGAIGEVIVTANKRAENLQSVAATVTAVSQDNLVRQGVKEITDITKVAPEVQVATGQFQNITIRGIRTGAFGPSTDSPNAVHVDGVYISRFTSLQGLFFDVQRIEVLDGPQGTLYGRNSAGGTMNIITNKPTQEFGGHASFEYGNYDAVTANVAVNVPLTDKLAMRAAYFHNSHKGYADNGTDDSQQDSGRISFLWKPTSNDSLLVTGDREQQGGKGAASAYVYSVIKQPAILTNPATGAISSVVAGTPGSVTVPIVTAANGNPRDVSAFYGSQDLNRLNTRGGGLMGQYDHDFGWATLTAVASYRDTFSHNTTGTTLSYPQDPRLITTGVVRPAAPAEVDANAKWNSQEIRLTSPSNQTLTYVVGLYRFHENSYGNHNDTFNVIYPNTSAATIGQRQITTVLASDIANPTNLDDAYAVFGQATYTPSQIPGLHLTGGLRYNDEKKSATGYELLNAVLAPASVFNLSNRWTATTYKANISYDLTPHNMVYVDNSTGFKSGGYAYGFTPVYQPEKITSYEIGTKNRFLDNRLQVNASAWYYDYRGLTTTINQFYFDTSLGRTNTILNTANASSTHILGETVSIDALITRDDIFDFNVTHLRTKFSSYDLGPNFALALANGSAGPGAVPADFNYSGTPVGNVPDWDFNTTYDHIFHVGDGGELDAQAALHYTGKRLFGNQAAVANSNNYIVGSPYATEDVSIRYTPASHKWNATAYVRNLTNKNVIIAQGYSSNANFLPASDPRVTFAYLTETLGAPRTFGIILSADF